MAVAGIGAVHDRIGKIASEIAAIEHRNPLNRAPTAGTAGATGKPATHAASANAFQQHLAAQTIQGAIPTLGAPSGAASSGLAGLSQAGSAGSSLAALNQGAGARSAMGAAGLTRAAGLQGTPQLGSAVPGGAALHALTALLQAGAQPQVTNLLGASPMHGAPDAGLANRAQAQAGIPIAGAAGVPGQPGMSRAQPTAADRLTSGIAALPTGTHPAIPDRRESKVPQALKGFGNGKIPADQLESVGVKDHQLWSPAAKAFKLMRAAAQRDGITIGVNSSYRDVACQQCMVDKYGIYGQGGRAAPPGKSNHGWGLSIDLQLDESAKKWMRANAKHYGFVEDVAREPWHWTFIADGDSVQANAQALLR